MKRRNAIRKAEPFHVAFLAMGTSFVYTNGVLCYTTDRGQMRLLDIKNSADHEIVIDVFRMLREGNVALPEFTEYRLKPIYFGHGVLTCELALTKELRFTRSTRYLIVIRPRAPELLLFEEQPLRDKTIVAATDKYLFLCHPVNEALWNYWGVCQFNLETRQWAHFRPRFMSTASRKGNSVAATVYEGYFYAVSSSEPLVDIPTVQPINPSICQYHVAWTRLSDPARSNVHVDSTISAWASPYSGPVSDERWDFLRLEKDEGTGRLMAIQIRMEYPEDGVHTRRVCIKRVLASLGTDQGASATRNAVSETLNSSLGNGNGLPITSSLAGSSGIHHGGYSTMVVGSRRSQQGFGSSSHASHEFILHHGDNGSTNPRYGVNECFVRSYFSTSNSFVDLVNDTLRNNGKEQLLRLRVMTETPGGGNETTFWPPRHGPSNPDPRLKELHRVMNPRGFDSDLEWEVDSGSFVYGMKASNTNHQKAIIYVGFDPTVKLHHLKAFNKARSTGMEAGGQSGPIGDEAGSYTEEQASTGTEDEVPRTFPPLGAAWAWMEEPLYFRPRGENGFDFFG